MSNGSACEIYLDAEKKKDLAFAILIERRKIKVINFDADEARDRIKDGWDLDSEEIFEIFKQRRINPLLGRWDLFHEEYNYDQGEFLLLSKLPSPDKSQ